MRAPGLGGLPRGLEVVAAPRLLLLLLLRSGSSTGRLLGRRASLVKALVPRRGFHVAVVRLERLRGHEVAEGVCVLTRWLLRFLVVRVCGGF